jgi:peptidyl-prolyl cis-trans isomerase B (cyclophilin B)
MVTDKGVILIKLFPQDAPISAANFIKLVKSRFYDGLTFHRVTDLGPGPGQGHIVQGGAPGGDPSAGPGWTIKGEFKSNGVNNPLKHTAGAVAMARATDPDSAGSQFYIVVTPAPFLDGNYAVFGQVIKGLNVAAKIVQGDKMIKVTLVKQ